MRAILPAAGVGSRISRSIQKPKSALDVGNISIIRHTAEMLLERGIKLAVVVGYRKEEIFEALEGLDVTYYHNPFYKVTNSIASLWFARDFISLDEDLILANADVFWETPIFDLLLSDERDIVMLGDRTRTLVGDYFFKVENGRITKYGKSELPLEERTCEYVGIAKLRPAALGGFLERINTLVESDMYNLWWENILYNYSAETPVYVTDVEGRFWAEVDYMEDYERILDYLGIDFHRE